MNLKLFLKGQTSGFETTCTEHKLDFCLSCGAMRLAEELRPFKLYCLLLFGQGDRRG